MKRPRKPRTVAYLRVSTERQDTQKDKAAILDFANERDLGRVEWQEETVSGRKAWKQRKIAAVIEALGKGDTLIVPELSRLGRSMLECMEILALCTEKQISLYALKGNWSLDGTIQSKILAMAFAMAAEIERELIVSRTKDGLAAAKAKGKRLGRPPGSGKSKLDQYRPEIEALLNNGSTQKFIAARYGTTAANLNRWLKKHNIA